MSNIQDLTKLILEFRDKRDWKQFHNQKDLALSLVLEASEVLEHFQWKNIEEINKYPKDKRQEIGKELADVFYWVLLLSNDLDVDLEKAFRKKMAENAKKYPVKKSKGVSTKYNKL